MFTSRYCMDRNFEYVMNFGVFNTIAASWRRSSRMLDSGSSRFCLRNAALSAASLFISTFTGISVAWMEPSTKGNARSAMFGRNQSIDYAVWDNELYISRSTIDSLHVLSPVSTCSDQRIFWIYEKFHFFIQWIHFVVIMNKINLDHSSDTR